MSAALAEQKDLTVWKDNRIIDSRTKLTLQALRVFTFAVSKLRPDNRVVTFRADEFVELLGNRDDRKGIYAELRAVAKEIISTPVSLPQEHRGDRKGKVPTWVETSLAASAELLPDGSFQLEFSEKLVPFLFALKDHYTPVELQTAMSLTSRHAFRLYELVRSWEAFRDKRTGKHKGVKFTLDDLYALLGVEPTEYKLYGHFKAKVLNVACKQIEEKSDLRFRRGKKDGFFDELKDGKRVAAVRFTLVEQMELVGIEQPVSPAKLLSVAPKPVPAFDPAPSPSVVLPSMVLREKKFGESVEAAAIRLAEAQARKRVEARRLALEAAERDAMPDPEMLALCGAELLQAQNELHELVMRDQRPPEPEDDPRG